MTMLKAIMKWPAVALFVLLPDPASAASRVIAADVQLPAVEGPVAQTAQSYAFNAAERTRVPQKLTDYGYVEEEYFIRGTGQIYDFPKVGELRSLGAGEYVTRILVRRPKNPADFNGAVVIEPFNPSHMADVDLMWIMSRNHFMREGIVWIGVTFKPVAGEALKRFDPGRYGSISFANPLPVKGRCPDLELGPNATGTEVGFSFDILSQVAALVRSNSPINPLAGMLPSRVYLTGYSQTAGLTRSYAVAISPYATREGGKRLYDGYVYGGHGPFNVLFNNCDSLYSADDDRMKSPPVGVPMIDVAVEGDVPVTYLMRRPDSDAAPDLFRRYEIAGATHSGNLIGPFMPRAEDFARAKALQTSTEGCLPKEPPLSHFPLDYALNAVWQNVDRWVVDQVPPPHAVQLHVAKLAKSFETVGNVSVEKDHYGNALAGVRSVAIDVPTARWHGSRAGVPRCMRIGFAEPFDQATLRMLYPSHEDYVRQVTEASQRLVAERWLTPADAHSIIEAAWHAPVP